MAEYENLSTSEKIRVALHRDVNAICKESCHYRGFEVTTPAMAVISELVYKKLSAYGSDLEAFAKHAKRTTINAEDVKLLVRRNPSLKAHLNKVCKTKPSTSKDLKRRRTFAGEPKTAKKKVVNIILSDDDDDCVAVNKQKNEET